MILQQIYSGNHVPNFHQNCKSFIEDITRGLFSDTLVMLTTVEKPATQCHEICRPTASPN